MIWTTGTIGGFHVIVRVPQRQETRGHQRCLWVRQYNFCVGFADKPNTHVMMDFKWRANLELCYLLFLSILWRQQARSQFHKDIVSRLELDETDFLFSFK